MKSMPQEKLEILEGILTKSQQQRLVAAGFFVGLIDDLKVYTAEIDIPHDGIVKTPKQKAMLARATEVRLLTDIASAISQEYFLKAEVEAKTGVTRTRLQVAMFRIGDHIKLSS